MFPLYWRVRSFHLHDGWRPFVSNRLVGVTLSLFYRDIWVELSFLICSMGYPEDKHRYLPLFSLRHWWGLRSLSGQENPHRKETVHEPCLHLHVTGGNWVVPSDRYWGYLGSYGLHSFAILIKTVFTPVTILIVVGPRRNRWYWIEIPWTEFGNLSNRW